MYGNEDAVGAALAEGVVPREQVHVTTKVWHENLSPRGIASALEASLRKLRLAQVDLYLVHWPSPGMDMEAVMQAMAEQRRRGLARAIGVANFPVVLLRAAEAALGEPPAANQLEYHALLSQRAVLDWCRPRRTAVIAYSPVAKGKLVVHRLLTEIGARHGVTAATVALAWLLAQPGVAAIPKSSRPAGQRENWTARDVRLTAEEIAAIDALSKDQRQINPAFAPAWDPA
jgi:2,5-diketo-D-gluconate reductase B